MMNKNQRRFDVQLACRSFVDYLNLILISQGKPEFTLTTTNRAVIKELIYYFCKAPGGELDFKKGIFLRGPVGTGKTTIMRAFSTWACLSMFRMTNCRDIQKEAAKNGFESLDKYSKLSYNWKYNSYNRANGYIIYCFDDFGAEKTAKFYGNDINIMEELIQDRYNEYQITGMLTHVTSNLKDGDLIEEYYGKRVRDRLREMFNFIDLNGQSFRR